MDADEREASCGLNVACIQVASENLWHESQVVGKLDAMWSTGVLALL